MTIREPLVRNGLSVDRGRDKSAIGRVDVLIAARDRADTIQRAVESALGQDEVRTVIVVDDASTDDTAVRASACDPSGTRVTVKRLSSNIGPSGARNTALELSTAPWIAILDGDDFFLPGRLGALLSKADECDLVADDIVQVEKDHAGKAALKPTFFGEQREPFVLTLEQFVLGNVPTRGVRRMELGFLKPLIWRSFIDQHGLRYDEELRLGEDYALYARALALAGRFLIVPMQGYVSVVRPDSISAVHSKLDLERFRDSDLRLCAMKTLSLAERRALKRHFNSVQARVQWLVMIEAFKARNFFHFALPLFYSPQVSAFLIQQLVFEIIRRTRRL